MGGKATHNGSDTNVRVLIDTTLYYEARQKTLLGKLTRPANRPEVTGNSHDTAKKVYASDIISRKKITQGDSCVFTLREAADGMATYGDMAPAKGDYGSYLHSKVVLNNFKSPAFPVNGKQDQRMVRESVKNIPAEVKDDAREFGVHELDHEFIRSLWAGASKSLLAPAIDGGKAIKLGRNGTAGVAQMCRHFYTPDTGIVVFSDVQATHNTNCNLAVQGIDATAQDQISLAAMKKFRRMLDTLKFEAPSWNGTRDENKLRCVHFCDPSLVERMAAELESIQLQALPRAEDHAVLDSYKMVIYKNMLFVPVPQLEAYRPAYDAGLGRPRFGADLDKNPRKFVPSSSNCLMITVGARAVLEAFDNAMELTVVEGGHNTGMDVVAHLENSFVRAEWWDESGEKTGADACKNFGTIVSVWYEGEY